MIADVVDILKFKAEQKGILLIGEVDCPCEQVYLDGMRTKQIIINLVSNAIKYT
jgi:signal transduction histidine kinase